MSADKARGLSDPGTLYGLLDLEAPGLERLKEAVLMERYGEAAAALKEHLASRASPVRYARREEAAEIGRHAAEYCEEDWRLAMTTADEVSERIFRFRFPWDMERTRIPVAFDGPIDWNHVPAGDPEWAYMLNRHRYWIALGQAYLLTEDERYAAVFCSQLEDWIDRNPVPPEQTSRTLTWRSIEAGLRCSNWTKALGCFLDSPSLTPALMAKAIFSLHEHAEYLAQPFTEWKRISNWGVLETCGLFAAALFLPEFKRSTAWRGLALERMKETARLQVLKDGVHWEQSPTYHHEVLASYLDMLLSARDNGIRLEEDFVRTVRRMARASQYTAKPDGRQVMLGDSDDSDIRSILTAAAVLFEDAELRFGGYERMDYDNAWLFGPEGIRLYDGAPAEKPAVTSRPFEASGHYAMRSGWDEQALYLFFHCGHLGGGHGHADMLHIDVHAYGRTLLTDLGRYNYSDAEPLRRELKGCAAHNTTIVDDIDFTEIEGTWDFGRIASRTGARWASEPGFDYVEGSHDGYRGLDDPVYPLRRIVFIKPHFWLLVDSFACKDEHSFKQYFHFPPGCPILSADTGVCRTDCADGANLAIIPVRREGLKAQLGDGHISREYNLIESNRRIVYERTGSGTVSMMQVLYPLRPGTSELPAVEKLPVYRSSGELAEDRDVEAVRIRLPGTGEEHTVVVCHRPPALHRDSYRVGGIQVFGEAVWIAAKDGRSVTTALL